MSQEKESRTLARRKIDSQLLYEIDRRHDGTANSIQQTDVKIDRRGRALVDISATVTDKLLASIESIGGQALSSSERYNTIRANVPLEKLEALACLNNVRFIQPAAQPVTN